MVSVRSLKEMALVLMEMIVVTTFSESAAGNHRKKKPPGSSTAYLHQRKYQRVELSSLCQIKQSKRA